MPDLPLTALEQMLGSQPRLDPSLRAHAPRAPQSLNPQQAQQFLDKFVETYARILPTLGLQVHVDRDAQGVTMRIESKG